MNDQKQNNQIEEVKNEQQVTQGYLLHAIYGMVKELKQTNRITISKRGLTSLFAIMLFIAGINSWSFIAHNCDNSKTEKIAFLTLALEKEQTKNSVLVKTNERLSAAKFALMAGIKDDPDILASNKVNVKKIAPHIKLLLIKNIHKTPRLADEFDRMNFGARIAQRIAQRNASKDFRN